MAGFANTSSFLLSSATLMIGPKADLHKLNPAAHSVGLAKNIQFTADPQYVELTQGINNSVVMSVRNSDGLKVSAEIYEFTPANLAYGAGLDGADASFEVDQAIELSAASITAAATAITVTGDVAADFPVGSYIFLQKGQDDYTFIAKVSAVAFETPTTTITFADFAIPTGMTFPAGTRIGKVSRIDFGGATFQDTYAAKIVGILPKDNAPFTIYLPKIKITKGLSVAFATDNFSNMPFELTPYSQAGDDPHFADYGAATAILFAR